jgi:hypothetical protein
VSATHERGARPSFREPGGLSDEDTTFLATTDNQALETGTLYDAGTATWVAAKPGSSGGSYIEPCELDIYPDSQLRLSYASDLFKSSRHLKYVTYRDWSVILKQAIAKCRRCMVALCDVGSHPGVECF